MWCSCKHHVSIVAIALSFYRFVLGTSVPCDRKIRIVRKDNDWIEWIYNKQHTSSVPVGHSATLSPWNWCKLVKCVRCTLIGHDEHLDPVDWCVHWLDTSRQLDNFKMFTMFIGFTPNDSWNNSNSWIDFVVLLTGCKQNYKAMKLLNYISSTDCVLL